MPDPFSLTRAREVFAAGGNVTEFLRAEAGVDRNTPEIIEVAYDLQAGDYVAQTWAHLEASLAYAAEVATVLDSVLRPGDRLLDAGTGEMTTLSLVLESLTTSVDALAFDISWSRLHAGRGFVAERLGPAAAVTPFVAEIGSVPVGTGAADVVVTSHALEPNGGSLEPLLRELFRVAAHRLVLFEPCAERASDEARLRMQRLGYITNLEDTVVRLGGHVERVIEVEQIFNPLNPTFGFVIRPPVVGRSGLGFTVPGTDHPLDLRGNVWHSEETGLCYPVVDGIPVLRRSAGILASGLAERPST